MADSNYDVCRKSIILRQRKTGLNDLESLRDVYFNVDTRLRGYDMGAGMTKWRFAEIVESEIAASLRSSQ